MPKELRGKFLGPVAGILALVSLGASPAAESPEELIRKANAAFYSGDSEAADPLYAAAAERTGDPGLVAFNRAAVLFQKGDFREAELAYLRTLDDAAIPDERRAKSLFNRGVCLLKRDRSTGNLRTAIACFDLALTLETARTDAAFAADVRHNLEIAKLLWVHERKQQKTNPPKASDPPPDAPEPERKPEKRPDTGPDQTPDLGPETPGSDPTKSDPNPVKPPRAGVKPTPTPQTTPGAGTMSPIPDGDRVQPESPEDTLLRLRLIAERLERERASSARLPRPELPNVRDW